jgi:hypothetical protein
MVIDVAYVVSKTLFFETGETAGLGAEMPQQYSVPCKK